MKKRHLIYFFIAVLLILAAVWIRNELSKPILALPIYERSSSRLSDNPKDTIKIDSILWSDADSGLINDHYKFRLRNVDAPEIGVIGDGIGNAKCEQEREPVSYTHLTLPTICSV